MPRPRIDLLPEPERRAVYFAYDRYRRLVLGLSSTDRPAHMYVPRDVFDLIEQAMQHMPMEQDDGRITLDHCLYVAPGVPQCESFLFKGLALRPGPEPS